jgi:hypothetical protein
MTKELITQLMSLLLTKGSMAMGAALSIFSAVLWLLAPDLHLNYGAMAFTWAFASIVFTAGLLTAKQEYQRVREELLSGQV